MVRILTSLTAFLAVIVFVAGAVAHFVLAVVAFAALQSPLRVSISKNEMSGLVIFGPEIVTQGLPRVKLHQKFYNNPAESADSHY